MGGGSTAGRSCHSCTAWAALRSTQNTARATQRGQWARPMGSKRSSLMGTWLSPPWQGHGLVVAATRDDCNRSGPIYNGEILLDIPCCG